MKNNCVKFVKDDIGCWYSAGRNDMWSYSSCSYDCVREAYIAIMKMIANGEINEKDLETKAVQDKLQNLFKDKLKK